MFHIHSKHFFFWRVTRFFFLSFFLFFSWRVESWNICFLASQFFPQALLLRFKKRCLGYGAWASRCMCLCFLNIVQCSRAGVGSVFEYLMVIPVALLWNGSLWDTRFWHRVECTSIHIEEKLLGVSANKTESWRVLLPALLSEVSTRQCSLGLESSI